MECLLTLGVELVECLLGPKMSVRNRRDSSIAAKASVGRRVNYGIAERRRRKSEKNASQKRT